MTRTFMILIVLGTTVSCFAQSSEFKGYMAYNDGLRMGYGYLIFPLTKDTMDINSTGLVSIDLIEPSIEHFISVMTI